MQIKQLIDTTKNCAIESEQRNNFYILFYFI